MSKNEQEDEVKDLALCLGQGIREMEKGKQRDVLGTPIGVILSF